MFICMTKNPMWASLHRYDDRTTDCANVISQNQMIERFEIVKLVDSAARPVADSQEVVQSDYSAPFSYHFQSWLLSHSPNMM